jgi:hypothetical protein
VVGLKKKEKRREEKDRWATEGEIRLAAHD